MYCSHCGKEINENDQFCAGCGAHIHGDEKHFNSPIEKKSTSGVADRPGVFWVTLATTVMLFILMLQKWISIPIASYLIEGEKAEFSLFDIFNFVKTLNHFIEDENMKLMYFFAVVLIVWFILCCVLLAFFSYKLFIDYTKSGIWGSAAMIASSVLSFAIIILIFATNSSIEKETEGLISNVFTVTFAPYIIAIMGLIGKFVFIKKLRCEMQKANINDPISGSNDGLKSKPRKRINFRTFLKLVDEFFIKETPKSPIRFIVESVIIVLTYFVIVFIRSIPFISNIPFIDYVILFILPTMLMVLPYFNKAAIPGFFVADLIYRFISDEEFLANPLYSLSSGMVLFKLLHSLLLPVRDQGRE
jgi:hypothetical protein